jgi:hypothetical protein
VQRLAVGLSRCGDRCEHGLARMIPPASVSIAASARTPGGARRIGRRRRRAARRARPRSAGASHCPSRAHGLAAVSESRSSAGGQERRLEQRAARAEPASTWPRHATASCPPLGATARTPPGRGDQSGGAAVELFAAEAALGGGEQQALVGEAARTGSTRKAKPVRWPIGSGPTLTSPSAATVTGSASAPRAPMSRTSTAVRRSTKRWVSRSCSASLSRLDLARALGPFGRVGSQSARWAI